METVVVGLDMSSHDAVSLRWAAEYCGVMGSELVGVVAYEPSQAETSPEWYDEHVADVRKQTESAMDATASAVPHRVDVRFGDPCSVIPSAASDVGAAVAVVGAHGTGGYHHLGLGTVAHHLARHLLIPLAVVAGPLTPLRHKPVVVGLDGSPGDVTTLEWAVRLAEAVDGRVCAVYASDPMASSYPHPYGATVADQAEEGVKSQVARVAGRRVDIATVVEIDEPVPTLARVADAQDASVVVVGRKGAGHLRGLLLGRVPSALPFAAHRPVVIVPRPAVN